MKAVAPVTIDFETEGIQPRPHYPPKPVGVSIKFPGKRARYYAFAHPTENNCTEVQAKAALKKAWKWKGGLLFQNKKFDVDVAETHWKLPRLHWSKYHDTMFEIFLDDPNQQTFSLKPSAERILGMKPEEQEAVRDWLLEHQPLKDKGIKISASQGSPHYWGRYICLAPGKLVGRYADGDVIRTERIHGKLMPRILRRGMGKAYDRERRLMFHLLETERQGLPVRMRKLAKDCATYRGWMERIDAWVRARVQAGEDVNLDSGEQLFHAMLDAGLVDKKKALRTPTGKFQFNKEALLHAVKDRQLIAVLKYRTQLKTCLNTFMESWLRTAQEAMKLGLVSKEMKRLGLSLIFTSWNQVKSDARGGTTGARTGRLSSTPNFQNIPKEFAFIFAHEEAHLPRAKRKGLPALPRQLKGLPTLPMVRQYVAPWPGEVLIDRDYSQQEPRILAHFDGDRLMRMYQEDPWMDFHDKVRAELAKVGLFYERKPVKNTGLGIIYGQGVGLLAEKNDMEVGEAKRLKDAILKLLPGLRQMYQEAKRRAAANEPIRTWGGREYFCEPPRVIEGRFRTFDYKLVNGLVQGSAADCTKEAIIRYCEAKHPSHRLLLNVHDQLTASVPKAHRDSGMEVLRKCMESIEFDVQMLTEGATSDVSWADLKDYDKRGKRLGRKAA